ncbi:MAG: hypothetical protein JNM09_16785 [Blastocatellia bacterium]|nr:hypothetical protein [Blastocatellia bacterium]
MMVLKVSAPQLKNPNRAVEKWANLKRPDPRQLERSDWKEIRWKSQLRNVRKLYVASLHRPQLDWRIGIAGNGRAY